MRVRARVKVRVGVRHLVARLESLGVGLEAQELADPRLHPVGRLDLRGGDEVPSRGDGESLGRVERPEGGQQLGERRAGVAVTLDGRRSESTVLVVEPGGTSA